jgi:hypothetical protein
MARHIATVKARIDRHGTAWPGPTPNQTPRVRFGLRSVRSTAAKNEYNAVLRSIRRSEWMWKFENKAETGLVISGLP